ncbi:MAG: 16S rRNA (guanine(527)-N(7))-methyltransferase RsmG [Gammaproteobacteria bacterium]|nr:16S rRNA (guanine(527)-N(7))-methyltransferase RsmG [Gammaproteobacteria bacterium]
MGELRARLDSGLQQLGLELPEAVRARLIAYIRLLVKWNKAYNLTAVRDPQEMVTRHLLDSLAVVPHLPAGRIIDVGSGAGLPGIPLALVFPERDFTLLDANGKKSRFLVQARAELGLANVTVVNQRVEQFHPAHPFDCVITRAFASVADILTSSRHLLASNGQMMAMKGEVPAAELSALPVGYRLLEVLPLRVPGLEQEQRHLIRIGRDNDSGSESRAGEGL